MRSSAALLMSPGTAEKWSAWIEPSGKIHRFYYGQHARVVANARHEEIERLGISSNAEIVEWAQAQGWIFIEWSGGEAAPDVCVVTSRSESLPGDQVDGWLRWCEEMKVSPSVLKIRVTPSPMSWRESLVIRARRTLPPSAHDHKRGS